MKDIIKFSLNVLKMYGASVLIALLFSNIVASENTAFRIFGTVATLLVLVALGFFEGGARGEADAQNARILENREKERGIAPTELELQKNFYPWKGFLCGLLGVSPVVLVSLFMLVAPLLFSAESVVFAWLTVVTRVLLLPYLGLFPMEGAVTWMYLPVSLIFPLIIGVSYLMGPRRFSKMIKQMHENEEKRRRRKKKRPMPK